MRGVRTTAGAVVLPRCAEVACAAHTTAHARCGGRRQAAPRRQRGAGVHAHARAHAPSSLRQPLRRAQRPPPPWPWPWPPFQPWRAPARARRSAQPHAHTAHSAAALRAAAGERCVSERARAFSSFFAFFTGSSSSSSGLPSACARAAGSAAQAAACSVGVRGARLRTRTRLRDRKLRHLIRNLRRVRHAARGRRRAGARAQAAACPKLSGARARRSVVGGSAMLSWRLGCAVVGMGLAVARRAAVQPARVQRSI